MWQPRASFKLVYFFIFVILWYFITCLALSNKVCIAKDRDTLFNIRKRNVGFGLSAPDHENTAESGISWVASHTSVTKPH